MAVIYGEGIIAVNCCDAQNRRHYAVFQKKCWGLGLSVGFGVHAVAGLQGEDCPDKYSGVFWEGSFTPFGLGGIFWSMLGIGEPVDVLDPS